MSNDENNPMGFGYLNDEKKTNKSTPQAEAPKIELPKAVAAVKEKVVAGSTSLFGKLKSVFGGQKVAKAPDAPISPVNDKPETKLTEPSKMDTSVKWQVPPGTLKVKVRILESNGRLINEYNISDFITLKPGQILQVVAE